MKILITGGCGFIGSNAAAHYLKKGDEVSILDDLSRKGAERNLEWLKGRGEFKFCREDIRDGAFLAGLFSGKDDYDLVLHLAAQVAVTLSVTDPRADFETNAWGTFNLLEAIRRSGRNPAFIFASTNKVYGDLADRAVEEEEVYRFRGPGEGVSEKQPLDFYSPYGCSKGSADQYVRDYGRIYDLRTVVLRQSCIYGPRQFGMEDQGWLAWFMIAGLLGRPVTVYGDGKQVRDILYISDLLECFDKVMEKMETARGKVYNVGGGPGNRLSVRGLLDWLAELTGREMKPECRDWRLGDQKIYVSDIGKARAELGWKPKVEIRTGLKNLFEWISRNRESIKEVLEENTS